jgi:hypothetical protein
MKVKCIDLKKPNNEEFSYTALKVGKEYNVLSIEFYDSESSFSKSIGDFQISYHLVGQVLWLITHMKFFPILGLENISGMTTIMMTK